MFRVPGGEKGWTGGGKEENDAATAAIEVVKILCQRLSLCLTSFFSTTLLMSQIDLVMLSVKINHNNYVYFIHFLLALLKTGGGGEHNTDIKSLLSLLLISLHPGKKMCIITADRFL